MARALSLGRRRMSYPNSVRTPSLYQAARRCFTSVKKVLSFGASSSGALGHGSGVLAEDVFSPQEVAGLPGSVVAVAAGHYHSMAITEGGQVWCWGRNSEGQLGRGHDHMDRSREDWSLPGEVTGLEKVHVNKVAGSGVASIAVGEDGSLWCWGRSKRGQLGLGRGVTEALLPTQIRALNGRRIVQVSLGWGHALACTSEGELYSWGYAANGRLGFPLGPATTHVGAGSEALEKGRLDALAREPRLVRELGGYRVTQVAAGLDHSLVLTEDGQLFAFGDDSLNQLGSTSSTSGSLIKAPLQELPGNRVLSTAAGLGHSLAVISAASGSTSGGGYSGVRGVAFSWGWNVANQLGRQQGEDYAAPGEIAALSNQHVLALAGGRAHSLAVTESGQLWAWGSGKNGRLGLGSAFDQPPPLPLDWEDGKNVSVHATACGFDHSLVLAKVS